MNTLSIVPLVTVVCVLAFPAQSSTPFSRSVNDFGYEVVKRLGGNDNLVISPTSLYIIMTLAAAGARAQTREQIYKGLKVRWYSAELYMNSRWMSRELVGKKYGYTFSSAHGLFIEKGYPTREGFNRVADSYKATVQSVDFASNGNEAMEQINKWAASETQNVIKSLLKAPMDPSTKLILLNPIQFEGTWETPFDVNQTKSGMFFKPSGEIISAEFMELENVVFGYYVDPSTGYKFLEIPYRGGRASMIIGLPIDETKFPDLEMTEDILYKVTRNSKKEKVDRVVLPKFKFEYEAELKNVLQAMGVEDLFTTKAKLPGISETGDLMVSSVFQKTAIKVDEGSVDRQSFDPLQDDSISSGPKREFIVNHPFLFTVLDFNSDIVMLTGRVVSPQ